MAELLTNFRNFSLFLSIFLAFLCQYNVNGWVVTKATRGRPWPMPASIQTTPEIQILEEIRFQFSVGSNQCDILEHAFRRYHMLIFNSHEDSKPVAESPLHDKLLSRLVVTIKMPCTEPQMPTFNMDESYMLKISNQTGSLSSNTIWGALRGLETFSQLVYQADEGYYVINSTVIVDKPRFSHRGVLLDTSRHFIPLDLIYAVLDGLSYNKMNVFHWHIVDDPSFPYESIAFPELSQKGAYYAYTHVYTQEDIFRVIEYARVLGIRVVPEFDTPGHTQSWGFSHPELLTKCYSGSTFNGQYGPLDPSKNGTYDFMNRMLMEIVNVFHDRYIHLGGDEVAFDCWKSNPDIQKFMEKMGYGSDYAKLEEYYMQKILNTVHGLPRKTGSIIWQEVVDNGVKVPLDTVVHVWKGGYQAELGKVTKMGLKTLLSSCWYLDYISYGKDWQKYYKCDPQDFNGSVEQKKLVFGGEACLWGELVDATNLQSRLWPRASAVAERLWSPQTVTNLEDAASRLEEHRCRMVGRGIPAEPPNGPGFCPREFGVKQNPRFQSRGNRATLGRDKL